MLGGLAQSWIALRKPWIRIYFARQSMDRAYLTAQSTNLRTIHGLHCVHKQLIQSKDNISGIALASVYKPRKDKLKILGLLHRTFSKDNSVQAKKLLYISTVRSQLQYCSPVWRPNLIRDIVQLEKIQRRATSLTINHALFP